MIKQLVLKLILPLVGLVIAMMPATAFAWNPFNGVCSMGGTNGSALCSTSSSGNTLSGNGGVLMKVTDFIALIAGIAAVIMIIVAGLKYVLAGGEAKAVSEAKNTIMYAIIGIIVIVLARSLISFVVNRL